MAELPAPAAAPEEEAMVMDPVERVTVAEKATVGILEEQAASVGLAVGSEAGVTVQAAGRPT